MLISPRRALTGADLQAALDHIGASVSSLSRDSGVPRYNLGLLRSKGVALSKAHDVALRQYLAEQGVEISEDDKGPASRAPVPVAEKSVRFVWPLPDDLPAGAEQDVLAMVEDNDLRIAELLKRTVGKTRPLLAEPEYDDATREALQELFTLLAENYVLLRTLRGWRALQVGAAPEGVRLLRDELLESFRQRLEVVGLVEPVIPAPSDEDQPEEADA